MLSKNRIICIIVLLAVIRSDLIAETQPEINHPKHQPQTDDSNDVPNAVEYPPKSEGSVEPVALVDEKVLEQSPKALSNVAAIDQPSNGIEVQEHALNMNKSEDSKPAGLDLNINNKGKAQHNVDAEAKIAPEPSSPEKEVADENVSTQNSPDNTNPESPKIESEVLSNNGQSTEGKSAVDSTHSTQDSSDAADKQLEKTDSQNTDSSVLPEIKSDDEPQEEIPSFKEFREKKEQEDKKVKESSSEEVVQKDKVKEKSKGKLIQKNYADSGCGAKIVSSDKELKNSGTLLNNNKDLYALIPCEGSIWFVVELCDTIQMQAIQLANYELFSSSVNSFKISTSENYPPKEWTEVGQFSTESNRDLQKFEISISGQYSKFVKFEKLTFRGKEHFCVLSTFQVLGLSMVDEYEEQLQPKEEIDPYDQPLDLTADPIDKVQNGDRGIMEGARDAVKNIVDTALNVLGVSSNEANSKNVTTNETVPDPEPSVDTDAVVVKVDEQGKEIKKEGEPDLRLKGEVGTPQISEVVPKPIAPKAHIMEGINLTEETKNQVEVTEKPNDKKEELIIIPESKVVPAKPDEVKVEKVENLEIKEIKDGKGVVMTNSPKKNSIFVELDKKIKELEKNLSLSNDYLETLSSRYKRVDNLFKPLEKTLAAVNQSMKVFEERLKKIEDQFVRFDAAVENHTIQMNEIREKANRLITSTNVILVLLIVILYMFWRLSYKLQQIALPVKIMDAPNKVVASLEVNPQEIDLRKRKKSKVRPSPGVLFSHRSETNLSNKNAVSKTSSDNKKPLESVQMDLIYPQPKTPPLRRRGKLR